MLCPSIAGDEPPGRYTVSTQLTTTILRALGRLPRERETPVLVAVSGGPDSVALAHALHKLSVPIAIAHLDHRTRDGASGADAEFVREVADRLDVPFHLRSENVESDAEATNLSFEEYARERRYAFLIEAATTYGFPAIATGHHADDQAETLLMRVLRGTTPRGLAGIPETTERDGVAIVRPLLRVRRSAILAYLHERKITYIEDETNRELGFVRNRVRHALLPQLSREYNPRLTEALNRLADAQRAEDDLLRTLADRFIKRCVREERTIRTEAFAGGHLALQRRLVLEMAWRHGVRPDFDHVDRAIDFILNAQPRKSFDLGNGVQLVSGTGTVAAVMDPPGSGRARDGSRRTRAPRRGCASPWLRG